MNAGGGAAPPAYVIRTLTALAGGVQPITRTVPVPGWAAGVGVGDGVGETGWLAAVGVGVAVAVGTAGRVFVAVGVTVDVGVAVFVGVGVAVRVGVGVGVQVGVAVAVLVGVGTGVAVLVGVNVAVGSGVGSSNRKFARTLNGNARAPEHTVDTVIVTVCPGLPVTVNDPDRLPPSRLAVPVTPSPVRATPP